MMKLTRLIVHGFRSLRQVDVTLGPLNVFIGANASGKSTILDVFRFLHEALTRQDFAPAVFARGGIVHLAWKGEHANRIQIETHFEHVDRRYQWRVELTRENYEFSVQERLLLRSSDPKPRVLLDSTAGRGNWWSEHGERTLALKTKTECALAAVEIDEEFSGRSVAHFIRRWGFFDPNPIQLRKDSLPDHSAEYLDSYGRNLAQHLMFLHKHKPEVFQKILQGVESVLGFSLEFTFRPPRDEDEAGYFVVREPGLRFPVHQIGLSSGTLRAIAVLTAILEDASDRLLGIEEPENYLHPAALRALVEHIRYLFQHGETASAPKKAPQILLTTHSIRLLDYLDDPGAVYLVRRNEQGETHVLKEPHPESVRKALEESGLGLGEFYETQGFAG